MEIGCGKSASIKNEDVFLEEENVVEKKEDKTMLKIGREAPLFEAEAYYNGDFTNVKLEDYRGKWVLLCFYPGDFTFV